MFSRLFLKIKNITKISKSFMTSNEIDYFLINHKNLILAKKNSIFGYLSENDVFSRKAVSLSEFFLELFN
jgi:hypothetical protein